MNSKRTLLSTSPDQANHTPKKFSPCQSMNSDHKDVFSWSKLGDMLDDKLKDVAKKEDVAAIKQEVEDLKVENSKLKIKVEKLTNRIEQIDRRSRSANVVVSGLSCKSTLSAKKRFEKICKDDLKMEVDIVKTRMLSSGKSFIFSLDTYGQAQRVIDSRTKLNGKSIYIQKDYTAVEQMNRYNLRKLSKVLSSSKNNIKVRLGEFCIFVDDIRYTWGDGKILAPSQREADYLNNILADTDCSFEVHCQKPVNSSNVSSGSFTQ